MSVQNQNAATAVNSNSFSVTRRPYQKRTMASRESGETRRYGNKFVWEVTPDYWKPSWGTKPVLGFVKADSEFEARYAAYDKGLLIYNATFGPDVRKVR